MMLTFCMQGLDFLLQYGNLGAHGLHRPECNILGSKVDVDGFNKCGGSCIVSTELSYLVL